MKRNLFLSVVFLLPVFLLACSSTNKHNERKVPLWLSYETIEEDFPDETFIARIGSGKSEQSAKMNADFELASFFSKSIKSSIASHEVYSSGLGNTTENKYLSKDIESTSQVELSGVRHTDAFYDKRRGEYFVCSYINRDEVWKILEPRLTASVLSFREYESLSKNEKDLFRKILFQNKAICESEKFYDLYFICLFIVPQKVSPYEEVEKSMQKLITDNYAQKKKCFVKIMSTESFSAPLVIKIGEMFTREGFVVTDSKPLYLVKFSSTFEAKEHGSVYRSEPVLRITVEKTGGEMNLVYSRKLESVSSYTKEAAESLAVNRMEKEIEKNFMNELLSDGER